jgi:hypothetical protein
MNKIEAIKIILKDRLGIEKAEEKKENESK